MINLLILFSICLSFIDISIAQSSLEVCQTPNKTSGQCVPLQKCEPLFSMVSFSPTKEQEDFVKRSQCGQSSNTDPHVCCPSESNGTMSHQGQFTAADLPGMGHCGTQAKDRIFGGEVVTIQDFPWLAVIHYKKRGKNGRFLCGGALINENYVITAAHCIRGPNILKNGFVADYVRLGEHDFRTEMDCEDGDCAEPVQNIEVAETIVHEDYSPKSETHTNDIALIRLAKPARRSDFVRPICLPIASHLKNKNYTNTKLIVAGFGRTENASQSEVKLKVEVDGFDFGECDNIYQRTGIKLSNKQLCAGGVGGRDSCTGDSGGPLMGEDSSNPLIPYSYLAGIVSFGLAKCGAQGVPGVYTRVDQYIDWILSNMKNDQYV